MFIFHKPQSFILYQNTAVDIAVLMQDQLQQAQSPPQALRPCVVDSRPKAEAEGRPQLVGLLGLQRGPFGGNHEGQWNKTLEKKPAFCKWGDVPTDLVALSPSCDKIR